MRDLFAILYPYFLYVSLFFRNPFHENILMRESVVMKVPPLIVLSDLNSSFRLIFFLKCFHIYLKVFGTFTMSILLGLLFVVLIIISGYPPLHQISDCF